MNRDKIGEDESYIAYRTDMCAQYERHLRGYDSSGFTFGRTRVILLESKATGSCFYVAYDQLGRPLIDFKDGYDLDFKIKISAMNMSDECNIVQMAQKKHN